MFETMGGSRELITVCNVRLNIVQKRTARGMTKMVLEKKQVHDVIAYLDVASSSYRSNDSRNSRKSYTRETSVRNA